MEYPVFKQEDYPQELGTGFGYTIAKFGCALTSVCSIVNWYGRSITPADLNTALISIDGFASNGTENKTLLKWNAVTQLYGEIILEHNVAYPTTPADMGMIDAYLSNKQPVVVGVSFIHDPKQTVPSHYVVIYRKNDDGTYECMDPWFGDRVVFDTRYAVNGMSVANAILQVVAYNGPIPQESATVAPPIASQQQATTPVENFQKEATDNWNLYLSEVEIAKQKSDRIQELEGQVQQLSDANTKLIAEIKQTKDLNVTLTAHLSDYEKNDSAAIEEGQKAMEQLKQQQEIVTTVSGVLRTKPTMKGILQEIDALFLKLNFVPKPVPTPQVTPLPVTASKANILSILGIAKEVK